MTVGKKIEQYRKQSKLSQEELAGKLFVSRQTVSQWENDQTSPTIDNFLRLCDVFGISMNDFFEDKASVIDKSAEYQEQYKWKYSEDDLNEVYYVIRKKDIWVFWLTSIFEFLIAIIALILKAKMGFALVCLFLIMGISNFAINQITYKSRCKQATKSLINREYMVDVDDGSILITVFDNSGKKLSFDRIYPVYIEKTWYTDNLFIIQYGGRRYIIKKNELPKGSQLGCLLGL